MDIGSKPIFPTHLAIKSKFYLLFETVGDPGLTISTNACIFHAIYGNILLKCVDYVSVLFASSS